jgi:hypothetical protein
MLMQWNIFTTVAIVELKQEGRMRQLVMLKGAENGEVARYCP